MRKFIYKFIVLFLIFGETLQADTTSNLVLRLPFDNNLSDSASTHIATMYNSTTASYTNGYDGTANGAFNFTGTNGIQVPTTITSTTGTISFRIKSSISGLTNITNGGNFNILLQANGDLQAYNPSIIYPSAPATIFNNQWHMLTYTFNDTNLSMYLDGVYVSSVVNNSTFKFANPTINIGHNSNYFLTGAIDDYRIYTRALSSSDVAELYSGVSSQPDITTGLIAHYEFEDNANDSTNTYNGTVTNGMTYVTGKTGKAASFSGTNHITVAMPDTVLVGGYTKSMWVYLPANNDSQNNLVGSPTHTLYADYYGANAGYLATGHNGAFTALSDTLPFPLGAWTHVAVTFSATGELKLYKNGILVNTITGHPAPTGGTQFYMGKWDGTQFPLVGLLDDVKIYNRVLTQNDITELFNYVPVQTHMVTSTADSGAGTLRQAILDANSGDTIDLTAIAGETNKIVFGSTITINKNLTFVGNVSNSTFFDGATTIHLFDITAENVEFQNITMKNAKNTNMGGAIMANGSSYANGSFLTLTNCSFIDNNNNSGTNGGALYGNRVNLQITNSNFEHNGNSNNGAALFIETSVSSTYVNIDKSSFYNNVGNAVSIQGGRVHFKNSTIANNLWWGIVVNSGAVVTMDSSTVSGNGIAHSAGSFTIKNSVLYADGTSNKTFTGSFTSSGYNFISTTSISMISTTGDVVSTTANPNLGTLTKNGITWGYPLISNSPLIDTGNCTAIDTTTIITDQFGNVRPAGSSCDKGAVEAISITPTLTFKAHGGVVQLDNSSSSSSIGYQNLSSLDNTSKFTIESWVNMKQPTDRNRIFNKYLNDNNRIELAVSNAGLFELIVSNGGNAYGYTANDVATWNEWSHIAMVYDGTQETNSSRLKLYINGEPIVLSYTATIPTITPNLSSAITKKIGSMVGMMDEFRLWSTAKTQNELQASMNMQLDGNESGLLAYYNFDERVGNIVKDITGNGNDGTITGNTRRLNFLDNTVDLGVSTYITTTNNTSLSSFSVGGWFKADTTKTGDYLGLVTMTNSVNGMFQLSYMSSGNVVFELFKDNGSPQIAYTTSDVNIKDGGWHFAALTYDNSSKTANLYVDGVLKTTQINATMPTTLALNSKINIGVDRYTGTPSLLDGASNVFVYNRTLSQTEVTKLMAGTPNIADNSLVGYWPIHEGTSTTIKDYSSSNNNGNITGSTYSWTNTAPNIYGDKIYTDYGINSWQKLVVENNTTQPLFSYFDDTQISYFNTSTGLFLYNSTHGDNTLSFSETLSDPNLTLSVTVNSLQDVISGGSTGTDDDDIILDNDQNDTFDGLDGNDTVVYQMTQSNYTVIKNSDGSYSITDSDFVHTDRLTNIEYISFSDVQNLLLADIANPSPKLTFKAHGGAVQFDKNAIITLAPSFSETLNEFNVEFWFNPLTQTSGVQKILELGSDTYIYANFTTKSIQIGTGGWDMWSASNSVTDNTWHHISVDFNGTSGTIYIDGVPSFSSATGGVPSTYDMNSTNYFIGSNSNSGSFMIDELRIWNSSRIQSEIQTNMNQQLDGNESGLMAYYNFDERVGTIVKDITGNGNDGNISGNITRLNFLGDSLKFDGVDDFVLIDNATDLNSSSFTINAWIKTENVGTSSNPIAFTYDNAGSNPQFYFKMTNSTTDSYAFYTTDSSLTPLAISKTIDDMASEYGEWRFFTGVVDRTLGKQKFYLDGELVGEANLTNPLKSGTLPRLAIGGTYVHNTTNVTADFNGSVAEVSYWNKPLTQTEIRYLMNSAPHTNDNSLVGYWPLNDGSGSVSKDYSSNLNNGTITGATWINTAPTVYGNTLYTDYGINSWQKLFVENNTTTPTFSLNGHDFATQLNNTTGLFNYRWHDDTDDTIVASTTNPDLNIDISVKYARTILYDQNGTNGDDVLKIINVIPDILDGKDGTDILVLSDSQSNYTIINNQDGTYTLSILLNGTPISIKLVGIEVVDFSDIQNVDISSIAIIPNITSGLVAYYQFEGNVNDKSGNDYNGSYSSFSTGKYGQAVSFNGSQYLAINSVINALPSGSSPRTVSMWLKPTSVAGNTGIISWGTYNTQNARFSVENFNGSLGVAPQWAGGDFTSNTNFTDDWQHITVVYNGGDSIDFYQNGVFTQTVIQNVLGTDGTFPLIIGASADGASGIAEWFNGQIDEVRIYDRALIGTEVEMLYSFNPIIQDGNGTDGDDLIQAQAYNMVIDGKGGNDTLILSGPKSSYTITKSDSTYTITDGTRTYVVSNIEYVNFSDVQNISVLTLNNIPTDINLTVTSINENQPIGTTIGTLATVDLDLENTHTYSFCGGINDSSFSLSGNILKSNALFDFETKESYTICIKTTDSMEGTFTKNFTIGIADINEIPTIDTNFTTLNVNEDNGTTSFDVNISDVEHDDLHFTIDSNNTNLVTVSIGWDNNLTFNDYNNTSLDFNISTVANAYGVARITLTLNDGDRNTTKYFDVNVSSVDDAPTFIDLNNTQKIEDASSFTISLNGNDLDGDTISYSVSSSNSSIATVVVTQDGNITVTPVSNANGVVTIEVNATANNQTVTKTFDLNITSVDDAPVLSTLSNPSAKNEDFSDFNITLSSSDLEDDNVTYSASSSNSSIVTVSIENNNTLVISSVANKYGDLNITIRVTQDNNSSLYDEQNITFTINPVNDTPTFETNLTNLTIDEDSGIRNFEINVSDIEGTELNVSIESNNTSILTISPSWNSLVNQANYNNLDFNISTQENANGLVQITITVNDGDKNSTQTFDINVTAINDAPVLTQPSNISKDEDFSDFNITLQASDLDNNVTTELIFSALSRDISKVTTSINGNILTLHSVPNANGIVTIDLNVTDGELSDTKSFDINISNVDDAVILNLIKISLDQDEYENFGSDDSITLTMPLFELNNNVDGGELQINQWMIDNANSYNIKTTSNFQNQIIDQLKTKESVSQNGNSFVTPTKEIKIVSEILLDAGIFTLGDDVEILFSNGAKGYEVVEKNGTSYLKYYLWNTIATDDLIKHFGFSSLVYKDKNITTAWTYLPLEGAKPLCNNFYKTELPTVCNQNNTIESVFNLADGVFKYNDFWSYWDKNGATYGFDRIGSISSFEGLIVKSSIVHTVSLPYNLTHTMNLKVGDFYKSGWYLVNIPFSMTITELTNEIASQGRILAHVFKYNGTTWEIYATDDENYATSFSRITTLLNGDVVWIEVK